MSLQNPINVYHCQKCQGVTVTIDREEGVTPFMIRCRAFKDCGGMMTSSFYSGPQDLEPTHEWRKPTEREYQKLDKATREDHVDRGGLLLYRIDGQEDEWPTTKTSNRRSLKAASSADKRERKNNIRIAKARLGRRLTAEEMRALP